MMQVKFDSLLRSRRKLDGRSRRVLMVDIEDFLTVVPAQSSQASFVRGTSKRNDWVWRGRSRGLLLFVCA